MITPSFFTEMPFGSTLQNHQSEVVAMNIMLILKRTGNTFRELTWDEYKTERLKDGRFSDSEKPYFDKVAYLSIGYKNTLINFSKVWSDQYIKALEDGKC